MGNPDTREREWFVPGWGPRRFRLLAGLSFYPYTLMNASYVVIGSLLAATVHFDRLSGMTLAYVLAVGVAAHSLDAMAPNKPWGDFLSRDQLALLAVTGLVPALGIGLYYAFTAAPLLVPIGVAEVFFLIVYNLELFRGRFHTDFWFATSWGFLPVLAGFVVQTNSVSLGALAGGAFGFTTAYVEISASRPYKELKKGGLPGQSLMAARYEAILKGIVASVLSVGAFMLIRAVLGWS